MKTHNEFKGKNNAKEVYVVSVLTKFIVFVLLFSTMLNCIPYLFYLSERVDEFDGIRNKLIDYVGYEGRGFKGGVFSEDEGDFDGFYDDTVDKFKGIYVDYDDRNERYLGLYTLQISKHYFDFNPVLKPDGETVSINDFIENKHNVLLPDNIDLETALKSEVEYLDSIQEDPKDIIKKEDINIIFYKSDAGFQLISPHFYDTKNNIVFQPRVLLYEKAYRKLMHYGTVYLAEEYFLKIENQNKFEQLEPYVKKHGLEDVFIDVYNVNDVFSDEHARLSGIIRNLLIQCLFYIIILIITVFSSSLLYSNIFLKKIVLKRINGFSFFEIHRLYLLYEMLTILLVGFFFIIRNKVVIDVSSIAIIFGILLVNLFASIFVLKMKEKENIYKVIKEGI